MTKTNRDSKLDRLDTFVLASVATILVTRTFLALTGYPKIGSDGLHIAHVLYGGIILVSAFLFLLLASKPNRLIVAIIGGIGFGLFLDEVGKFVTQDNDYFYRPAVGLMYIALLTIWLIARLIIVRTDNLPFMSPAEWPARQWQRMLIRLWCLTQAIWGLSFSLFVLYTRLSGLHVATIPYLGVLATALYAMMLFYGLWQCRAGAKPEAAHDLRGATLFGIVAVFPFFFMKYPTISFLAFIPTIFTVIGLSEVSFQAVVGKLSIRTQTRQSKKQTQTIAD